MLSCREHRVAIRMRSKLWLVLAYIEAGCQIRVSEILSRSSVARLSPDTVTFVHLCLPRWIELRFAQATDPSYNQLGQFMVVGIERRGCTTLLRVARDTLGIGCPTG
jgi:hypothetical protein